MSSRRSQLVPSSTVYRGPAEPVMKPSLYTVALGSCDIYPAPARHVVSHSRWKCRQLLAEQFAVQQSSNGRPARFDAEQDWHVEVATAGARVARRKVSVTVR